MAGDVHLDDPGDGAGGGGAAQALAQRAPSRRRRPEQPRVPRDRLVQQLRLQGRAGAAVHHRLLRQRRPDRERLEDDHARPLVRGGSRIDLLLNVGLQSGPTFTYTYKGGAASTGCRPSGGASTASLAAPAASGRVTFSFNHTGVPKRGESPTLVTSATGGSGSFSICGDPAKKWVTGTLAKGTVIHLDGHAHLGRTVNDRLTLKVVGARVRAYGGPVGRVAADLFVKVTASNDALCKVGRLGSIELIEAAASGGGDSQVTVNLCGRDHDHAFTHFDFGLRGPVRVAVQITIPK